MKTKSIFRRWFMASSVVIIWGTQVAFAERVNKDTTVHKQIKSRKMVVAVPDESDSYKVVLSKQTMVDILSRATDDFKGWTPAQKTIEIVRPPILEQGENSKDWVLILTGVSKAGQEVVVELYLKLNRKKLVGIVRTGS